METILFDNVNCRTRKSWEGQSVLHNLYTVVLYFYNKLHFHIIPFKIKSCELVIQTVHLFTQTMWRAAETAGSRTTSQADADVSSEPKQYSCRSSVGRPWRHTPGGPLWTHTAYVYTAQHVNTLSTHILCSRLANLSSSVTVASWTLGFKLRPYSPQQLFPSQTFFTKVSV